MKHIKNCAWCGKEIEIYTCRLKKNNFYSRECLAAFSSKTKNPKRYKELKSYEGMSKNMTGLNRELNPNRMTPDVKRKLSQTKLDSGECKGYRKVNQRHEHRSVAEQILGRPLKKGEVVHHIDGNKRNNNPDNLMIFPNQSEHVKFHIKGGEA